MGDINLFKDVAGRARAGSDALNEPDFPKAKSHGHNYVNYGAGRKAARKA